MKLISSLKKIRLSRPVFLLTAGLLLFPGLVLASFELAYRNKIYPGVQIGPVPVGNLTYVAARQKIEKESLAFINSQKQLEFVYKDEVFTLPLKQLNLTYQLDQSTRAGLEFGRTGSLIQNLSQKWQSWRHNRSLPLKFEYNQIIFEQFLAGLRTQLELPAIEPNVQIENQLGRPIIQVYPGQTGYSIQEKELLELTETALEQLGQDPLSIPLETISPSLTQAEAESLKTRAQALIGKKILLHGPQDQIWTLQDSELVNLLSFNTLSDGIDRLKLETFVNQISTEINRPPQNAVFQFAQGSVVEFQPDQSGLELQVNEAVAQISSAMKAEDSLIELNLPILEIPAQIKTQDANSLGIKELVASGESWFRGSIPNRVHNIKTGAAKLNGLLIPPGHEVSFNESIGEIVEETGFKIAYVIKLGQTIPEVGGGVCQVSTTFFRAALNAGLPITERHAHAYRVGYYEQGFGPGLDATVYMPSPDLKFINDTPAHLLVQTRFDAATSHLVFELYGTADGRRVEISKPILTNQTEPPPPLYLPDPTLPIGTTKQTEHAIWGGRAYFTQKVFFDEALVHEDTFVSNYQAWQAVYLEGTKTP